MRRKFSHSPANAKAKLPLVELALAPHALEGGEPQPLNVFAGDLEHNPGRATNDAAKKLVKLPNKAAAFHDQPSPITDMTVLCFGLGT